MRFFNLIYAKTCSGGIGMNNKIPWSDKEDMKHFREITTNHVVIIGRLTAESIGKMLPDRINLVVTKNKTFESCMEECYQYPNKQIFIIGGGMLYNYIIDKYSHLINVIYETVISSPYTCDVHIKDIDKSNYAIKNEQKTQAGNYIRWYVRNNQDEKGYLELVNNVLVNGSYKNDRTGVGTKSLFAKTLEYDIDNGKIPLLTTKFVPLRLIFEELRWMLLGIPSINYLKEQNVHIWDANIENNGGHSGPIYPFQWRHAGAEYFHDEIQSNQGLDQIKNIIELIKNNENSRRILLCNWNCKDLPKMALPPCHVVAQWFVDNEFLDCMLYQRSGDLMLGVPFNIVSYSLLTHMIAYITNKKPRKFTHVIGDCHIYSNHIENAELQIVRSPTYFPSIHITKSKEDIQDISDIEWKDIQLLDYKHQGKIDYKMAV